MAQVGGECGDACSVARVLGGPSAPLDRSSCTLTGPRPSLPPTQAPRLAAAHLSAAPLHPCTTGHTILPSWIYAPTHPPEPSARQPGLLPDPLVEALPAPAAVPLLPNHVPPVAVVPPSPQHLADLALFSIAPGDQLTQRCSWAVRSWSHPSHHPSHTHPPTHRRLGASDRALPVPWFGAGRGRGREGECGTVEGLGREG
jgi:hypothetical protein